MLPERRFIERLRRLAGKTPISNLVRGIGDDCAILQIPTGQELLVTTDLSVEDVHFRREWHPPRAVGHRCLARGLSDIAAMGGKPLASFLSLAVPPDLPQKWVNGFLLGLLALGRQFHVPLAGGDTSSSKKITADITVLGTVPTGRALLRSGAHDGDQIYVTGKLGGAAAVLNRLLAGEKVKAAANSRPFYPLPRVKIGCWLRERKLASAMIDISDGLSVDLTHICEESKASALINAAAIPVEKAANLDLALHGGDDYELLFTAPEDAKIPSMIAGVPVTMIGKLAAKGAVRPVIRIRNQSGQTKLLSQQGWQHFVRI